jgi:hypothetical protein
MLIHIYMETLKHDSLSRIATKCTLGRIARSDSNAAYLSQACSIDFYSFFLGHNHTGHSASK